MSKRKYAIVDIETTGGLSKRDKITEIAIVLHDGKRIIEQFDTLINPERSIPPEITRITGITDDMVQDSPKFYEVAKKIVELTQGAIFVAHNVRFDYSFIKYEFKSLGFTFTRRQLCTVKLTRKTFPGLRSYGLGSLIREFNISVQNRHRALDDALATTEILEIIFDQENSAEKLKELINLGIKEAQLPKGVSLDDMHDLPEETGIYYFHNADGQLVYIGKAINIKRRVFQHFNKITNKANNLYKMVHSISYEITGSELVALLVEAREIKKWQPPMNKAMRKKNFQYFLTSEKDENDYEHLNIKRVGAKNLAKHEVICQYTRLKFGKYHLQNLIRDYGICQNYTLLKGSSIICNCLGKCTDQLPNDHNASIESIKNHLQNLFPEDMIIIDDGRTNDEQAVISIEDGRYYGFGYISKEDIQYGIEEIKESIKKEPYYPVMNSLIWNHLNQNKLKVLKVD